MPDTINPKKPPGDVSNSRIVSGPTSGNASPTLKPKASSKLRKKSRPHIKRLPSGHNKLVFSVDDDIDDDIDDDNDSAPRRQAKLDKEYLEGYNDALKALYLKKSKKELPQQEGSSSYFPETPEMSKINEIDSSKYPPAEGTIRDHLLAAQENMKALEDLDEDTPLIEDDEDEEDDDEVESQSVKSSSSSQTMESLNLRERQDAINSTHPFGIKIWKPSLYKKKRSVATRAEEDIHEFNQHKPTINLGVHLSNFLWTITLGLFLYFVCTFFSVVLFFVSGFGIQKNSRVYIKLIYKVGKFWLHPFGKFVLLNKDENYLDEDDVYGSSIGEFHRWRREEEGRLFFAPPRRNTNSNNESQPLIKDHKGRALRDSYSFLQDNHGGSSHDNDEAHTSAIEEDEQDNRNDIKVRFFGRGSWTFPRVMFYLLFYCFLQPIFYLVGIVCWLLVFTIPMCNVTMLLCTHLKRHPLALHFEDEKKYYAGADQRKRANQSILLCTYRCSALHYYKYTIDGTNVFFMNLLMTVVFVIFDFYVLKERWELELFITKPVFLFCACLFSTIPLAFYIGQAVASISAQSSMGVGAVINAFFSTVVEIFLYCVALSQSKSKIVEGGMIGSILAGVLLLPGMSMCAGAVKRKTQRYNPRSAGVSSTMLLFGMVILFAPSLFYQIYGSYEIRCKICETTISAPFEDNCTTCRFIQPAFALDTLYYNIIRPFSFTVAVALLLAYACGLLFTLRTHASLIWATTSNEHSPHKKDEGMSLRSPSLTSIDSKKLKILSPILQASNGSSVDAKRPGGSSVSTALPSPSIEVTKQRNPKITIPIKSKPLTSNDFRPTTDALPTRDSLKDLKEDVEQGGGHDAPNWSRSKSSIILLSATILYAVIAEILVDVVDGVLQDFPINPKFLGLTVFALVPNTTEFLNAISFALGGNVALSMEIGSAYALQVVLIQVPVLAIYSMYRDFGDPLQTFSLVFPRWDIIATLISIYLFTYIYAEGKSNYFKGVILMLIYSVMLVGFYLNDFLESLDDGYNQPITSPSSF
ncbi:hypothetical protein CANTEDRAFT_131813 [Yamadazyma tenuis ATCC 10573]|uniref:Calcium permease n=1 Tax=Candida tenuis (strain ATCC 10573 / BCRC 21748 / CBS 615 / JCM 9827 / NBRC 10315 / NRRL Y-1498 / VKM Y-70) TaxID=590646 RepID=G3B962_CANTC|nr:uncharacterized protein CANTEDRAFT_131813 [Yamadazyma tenuis ATCC 10573]EGV62472.1 hypothetical protein CANTEDRAFT_131813 [Yamadazyma tenuis ATCC 10573]